MAISISVHGSKLNDHFDSSISRIKNGPRSFQAAIKGKYRLNRSARAYRRQKSAGLKKDLLIPLRELADPLPDPGSCLIRVKGTFLAPRESLELQKAGDYSPYPEASRFFCVFCFFLRDDTKHTQHVRTGRRPPFPRISRRAF